jgi:hypothetical protein
LRENIQKRIEKKLTHTRGAIMGGHKRMEEVLSTVVEITMHDKTSRKAATWQIQKEI